MKISPKLFDISAQVGQISLCKLSVCGIDWNKKNLSLYFQDLYTTRLISIVSKPIKVMALVGAIVAVFGQKC